jgi:hypothetical protein
LSVAGVAKLFFSDEVSSVLEKMVERAKLILQEVSVIDYQKYCLKIR